jgi:hypothetical protein
MASFNSSLSYSSGARNNAGSKGSLLPFEQFLILVAVQVRPPFPFVLEYGKTHAKMAHFLSD